jgi:hypothetical protein
MLKLLTEHLNEKIAEIEQQFMHQMNEQLKFMTEISQQLNQVIQLLSQRRYSMLDEIIINVG